jgi:hypothetical protein
MSKMSCKGHHHPLGAGSRGVAATRPEIKAISPNEWWFPQTATALLISVNPGGEGYLLNPPGVFMLHGAPGGIVNCETRIQ